MTDGFIEKLLTLYGPLGMGWIAFVWERMRTGELTEKLMTSLTSTAVALEKIAARVEAKT